MNLKSQDGVSMISIVIPVYNEEESIEAVHKELVDRAATWPWPVEVVYVDDGSKDRSVAILERLVTRESPGLRAKLVRLRRNYGQTAAMAAGFDIASGEFVLPMDADGQNDPGDIPKLVDLAREGFDVVSGWRKSRQDKLLSRTLPSMIANRLIGRLTGVRLHDYGCTLKAYRRSLLSEIRLYGEMHRFIPVYLSRIGARVTEVPVRHRPRRAGTSKYGIDRTMRVLFDLLLAHFVSGYYTRPMHFFGKAATWLAALAGVVVGAMMVFKWGWMSLVGIHYSASFVQTPLPALAGTLLVGAVNCLCFGLLGEILIRVHYESGDTRPYALAGQTDGGRLERGDTEGPTI